MEKAWGEEIIHKVWEKGKEVDGYDKNKYSANNK